ncbi:VOC family protein [Aeoliella sp.]|uniref:VOC family protein n=1 Tax=Aeoliella sp. TaxID=2795800 RepID=UPI003CCC2329
MASPIPTGREGLIPHLVCSPCSEAIEFYQKAFGAESAGCLMAPDGQRVMHAEILIDGKVIYLADDFPECCGGSERNPKALGGTPVTVHQYVKDCDAAYNRAVEAGATPMMPMCDMFWGDRYGIVTDPFGHNWSFATHQRDLSPEEMQQAMIEAFEQADAAQGA